MINITFSSLELTNYRKIDHIQIGLANKGVVRVEGRNGSGKSSIFEGLTWTLFGIDSRKSNIKSIIRFGESKTIGILKFKVKDTTYRIVRERTAATTDIILYQDEKELKFNTAKDAQVFIDSILGIDANTFYRLIFLRQYNVESFFEQTDSYQKSFLDSVFDFSIFNTLYDHYDSLIKTITNLENEFSQIYNWLESEKNTLEEENNRLGALTLQQINTASYETELEELTDKIASSANEIKELTSQQETLNKELPLKKQVVFELETSIKQFKEKENFFPEKVGLYKESLEAGKCIVCDRKLTQTLEKRFNTVLVDLASLHEDLKTMNTNLTKEKEDQDTLISRLHETSFRIQRMQYDKTSFETKIKTIHETIEQSIKSQASVEELIKSRDAIIVANNDRIHTINQAIDIDFWTLVEDCHKKLIVIRDLFGKKGLKNNFLDVYIVALAANINSVLEKVLPDTRVDIFTEKQLTSGDTKRAIDVRITKNNNLLGYFDLSGGERKRLDLAFILATHSLLEDLGDFSSNILILDEAFDGLDAEGMEQFSDYLRGYAKSSIFVITHTPYTTYADNLITMGD